MLGLRVKMLSCPVLKPFAVFSSRRSQYRSRPSRAPKKLKLDRRLSTWLLRSWTGFLIHLLLMKSGNAENGGSLKGRKNFEICATLLARDRRAKSKGAICRHTNSKFERWLSFNRQRVGGKVNSPKPARATAEKPGPESRPPAENTAKKQRGQPFKAGRSGCRRSTALRRSQSHRP
jgi:hypothetical protein